MPEPGLFEFVLPHKKPGEIGYPGERSCNAHIGLEPAAACAL